MLKVFIFVIFIFKFLLIADEPDENSDERLQ